MELSLNLSPPWLAGAPTNHSSDTLRDYLARLQHELRKIESFKRELPLSVLLLTNAIGRLKEEVGKAADCDLNESPRAKSEVTVTADGEDKKNWMRSAQLWSSDHAASVENKGGAISSFTEGSEVSPVREEVDRGKPVLGGPGMCLQVRGEPVGGGGGGCRKVFVPVLPDPIKLRYQASPMAAAAEALQGPKKQRRCWSPELHRRFIDSLEKLGGSRVATPKQIRELMQVNGLTNDEVKSHLQKYRLHIRKHPNSTRSSSMDKLFLSHDSQADGGCGGGGGVVGRVKAEGSQSSSPQGPLQLAIRSAKCNSAASRCPSNEEVEEDGEEKSDSHSWGGL